MAVQTFTLQLATQGNADPHDITAAVAEVLGRSGLVAGTATIFCPSSTSAVTTIEYEPGCVEDFRGLWEDWIPTGRDYAHNAAWDDGNGHSHLRAAVLGPSLVVPFADRKLTLGRWQQILHIDFDIRPRQRSLIVQLMGE